MQGILYNETLDARNWGLDVLLFLLFLTLSPQFQGAYGSCEIAIFVKKKKKIKKIC